MASGKIETANMKHAHLSASDFTSSNGTIWKTESHLDIYYNSRNVIMTGFILLQNTVSGLLQVSFQRPEGLPSFSIPIVGEAYRVASNILLGDFCYCSPAGERQTIAERNMFADHDAAIYARIDISCAIGYF